jgi:hypothetical protein
MEAAGGEIEAPSAAVESAAVESEPATGSEPMPAGAEE